MAADAYLTLTGSGANRGVISLAPEGTTTIASLNDWMRASARTTLDLFRQARTVHQFERDGAVANDDDGRTAGYTLMSENIDSSIYFAAGLSVLAVFTSTNAANPSLKVIGIVGADNGTGYPLTSSATSHFLGAGVLEPLRPYLLLWQNNTRRWLVVGTERNLTQQRLLDVIADGGIPLAKLNVPDGSITTDLVADDAITDMKLGHESVGTIHLKDDAITRGKLRAGLITGNLIDDRTIRAGNIILGTLTANLFAEDAIPTWTTEVIDTTGSAVSHTITAKEVEITIWGAGGGGTKPGHGGASNGGTSSIVYSGQTIQIPGGQHALGVASQSVVPYSSIQFPTIEGTIFLQTQGAGAGGGQSKISAYSAANGLSGSLVLIFINKSVAESITLAFTLGAGGTPGTSSGAGNGAPARALLRYR